MRAFSFSVLVLLGASFLFSCDGRFTSSRKKNYDSLFLNIYLGMEQKAFYDYCWELNRQKVITHGPTNQNIEYHLTELSNPVIMRFYPSFYEGKINEMPVTFAYEAWAPWNRQFQSDTLLNNMLNVFKKWYGDDFKVIEHRTMGKVYYKMDGYRRINLFIRDDQFVQAVFTDMRVAKKLKEEQEKNEKVQN